MELRDYQIEAKNAIFEEWEKGIQKTLLVLPTGCHAEGEKLLMADGTILAVENIKAGDHLLGMDGRVRRVLAVTSGTDRLYRIMPVKGKPFTVTGSHQLTLVRTNEKKNPLYPCQNKGGEIIDVCNCSVSVNKYDNLYFLLLAALTALSYSLSVLSLHPKNAPYTFSHSALPRSDSSSADRSISIGIPRVAKLSAS